MVECWTSDLVGQDVKDSFSVPLNQLFHRRFLCLTLLRVYGTHQICAHVTDPKFICRKIVRPYNCCCGHTEILQTEVGVCLTELSPIYAKTALALHLLLLFFVAVLVLLYHLCNSATVLSSCHSNFQVDSIYNTANISLSPWMNYTFRVIAYNKIGESDPSFPTPTVCTTKDAVPDFNPQNLRTIGDRKGILHIEWTVSGGFAFSFCFQSHL